MNLNKIASSNSKLLHRVIVYSHFTVSNIALSGVRNSQRYFSVTHHLNLLEYT